MTPSFVQQLMIAALKKFSFIQVSLERVCYSQWEVGAQCQAVWSEDGLVYPATVLSVDGDYCTVRFHGYGNEEDMALSSLMSPSTVLQTQENCQVSLHQHTSHRADRKNTEKLNTLKESGNVM